MWASNWFGVLVTEGRVFAVGVVVAFDVIEDFCPRVRGVLEASVLEHFEFERSDEGFGPGAIVRVGPGGHALPEASRAQGLAERGAAVLAATITMKDGVTGLQGWVECGEDEIGAQVVGQTPADDAPRTQINDHGEVKPSCAGRDEGNVPRPNAVGNCRQGLAGEEIWRRLVGSAVAGFGHERLWLDGVQAPLGHEATDCRYFVWGKE